MSVDQFIDPDAQVCVLTDEQRDNVSLGLEHNFGIRLEKQDLLIRLYQPHTGRQEWIDSTSTVMDVWNKAMAMEYPMTGT